MNTQHERRMGAILAALLILLLASLTGCGGGGSDAPDASMAPQSSRTGPSVKVDALRVIGNSITYHPAVESLDWHHSWGMATSTEALDFAHQTAAALGVPMTVKNFSGIEWATDRFLPHIPDVTGGITQTTAVVVQLGDNVKPGTGELFRAGYAKLLDAVSDAPALVCTSTWWHSHEADAVIREECQARGGRYVFLGDLYAHRQDDVGRYSNAGVDAHPHDWGHTQIAARVVSAIREF